MICVALTAFAYLFQSVITGIHERTFVAIKPDGVQRRLVGEIIRRFEQKGFKLVGMKILQASENLLRDHYIDLKDRPFYNGLVKYMSSGPLVAMVWQGLDVVKITRAMMGETNPADSAPGTIRGDFCVEVGRRKVPVSPFPTSPISSPPGISGWIESHLSMFSTDIQIMALNVIHGSDSVERAVREISLWFQPEELICWNDCAADWIYE
ncbi:nucleoside diphosphate kinase 3 isoform X1 [Chiloscyllium plagiosum]|uniref:nucleoside diphosphate kinase 3 isoform X1 n=1 Tax=Chiloscyllium plagiosum TaxID=36176 RepID=UPI001CB84789|nr:nucleoside diphosphate kinase 3 isoform X1 [Chiloscyllium plagiosum]